MTKFFSNKWINIIILLAMLLTAIFLNFSNSRWRQQISNFTFDYYNIIKPHNIGNDVVIVDIDEASLSDKNLGQWPWSRTKLAKLITELNELGAAVIAFDMVFSEPDRASPQNILGLIDKDHPQIKLIKDTIDELPDNDEVFANTIKSAGNIVTGFGFTDTTIVKAPRQIPFIITCTEEGGCEGDPASNYVRNLDGAATNLKPFTRNASGNGSFFVSTDTDGIIRRVPMLVGHQKHDGQIVKIYPGLAIEVFRVLKKLKEVTLIKDTAVKAYGLSNSKGIKFEKGPIIPTTSNGEFLVYYGMPDKDKWYISAKDVFDGTVDSKRIKHKVVLIGTSAVGLKDIRSTPLSPFRPGVEVHLNIIDQIIQKKFLYRSIEAMGMEIIFIMTTGLIIIAIASFVGGIIQFFILMISISVGVLGGWYAFIEHGWLIDVLYINLSFIVIFIASILLTYIRTEADRKMVSDAFGHYISPEFMEELTKDPDKLQLGGEVRDLSVMFTDIRNFTTISESMTPEALIQLMNDFLTPMSDLVMSNRGTIDKYMGDAMMAFWNAPLDDENHARNACITALKMDEALAPINEKLRLDAEEKGTKPLVLAAGLGINSGASSVGNMGSKQRFAYSALGDTVNLASRLEGQTKSYGVSNLISAATYKQAREFAALELDLIRVKGKTKPVRIFTLMGDPELAEGEAFKEWKAYHNTMIKHYRAADFNKTLMIIKKCRALSEGKLSGFYDLYEKRIGEYHAAPPPEDWDGVYTATTK